jgi:hypothetical protein
MWEIISWQTIRRGRVTDEGEHMKRYNIDIVTHTYGEPPSIRENTDGKWVYADDALKEIGKRDDLIYRMLEELDPKLYLLIDEAEKLLQRTP